MKSHAGFRLVSKVVTLSDLERRNDCQRVLSAVAEVLVEYNYCSTRLS